MQKMYRLIFFFVALLLLVLPVYGQDGATISLELPTLQLQTGQEYTTSVRIDNISELWIIDLEIEYDPSLLYVMGTASGSPVTQGELFPASSSRILGNQVAANRVRYTISMLNPGDPLTGSGVVGIFRIYPLAPGTAQLRFASIEARQVNFTMVDGQRQAESTTVLSILPVLAEVTITGDPVEPPSEATATPTLSPTPDLAFAQRGDLTDEPEATLANATAVPRPTEAPATDDVAEESGQSPLLPVALLLIVVGGGGMLVLLVLWRRGRR